MALAVPMSGSDRFAQFVMGFPWRMHSAEVRAQRQRIVDDAEEFGVEADWWTSTILTVPMSIPVPPIGRRPATMGGARKEVVNVAKHEQGTQKAVAYATR